MRAALGTGDAGQAIRAQIRHEDACKEAADEEWEPHPELFETLVKQDADDDADMNGEHGCQHVHIVEAHRGVFPL